MKYLRVFYLCLLMLPLFFSPKQNFAHAGPNSPIEEPAEGDGNFPLDPYLSAEPLSALNASGWFTETIDNDCNSGESVSLSFGNSNYGKAAYHENCDTTHTLKYAFQINFMGNKIWFNDIVAPMAAISNGLRAIDLALDQDGIPTISYQVYSGTEYRYDLRIARNADQNWQFFELPLVGDQSSTHAIVALDGWVYTSYHEITGGSLDYLSFEVSGTWPPTPITVDTSGAAVIGVYSDIVLRTDNQPRLVYSDATNKALKYASTSDGGAHWTPSTLISGIEGRHPSMTLNYLNDPRISYYDDVNDDLGYIAYNWLFGWGSPQFVDGTGADVGLYSSLALNSVGRACIAYYDKTNGDLKFAEQQSDFSWRSITVDSSGDVGMYASLAFDSAGNPHIAYFDKTKTRLLHAYYSPPNFLPLVMR